MSLQNKFPIIEFFKDVSVDSMKKTTVSELVLWWSWELRSKKELLTVFDDFWYFSMCLFWHKPYKMLFIRTHDSFYSNSSVVKYFLMTVSPDVIIDTMQTRLAQHLPSALNFTMYRFQSNLLDRLGTKELCQLCWCNFKNYPKLCYLFLHFV